jgi:hypothetical protein
VTVEGVPADVGGPECVALKVRGLGPVGSGDAHISDQHGSCYSSFIRSFK